MYKLIKSRIYDIVLLLLLVWTFYLFHGFSQALHKDIWIEIALFFSLAFYASILRNKSELQEVPELNKYVLPVCKPLEWLMSNCHNMWEHIGFLKSDVIKINKEQYEKTYPILSVLGNFMIISYIQIAQWITPMDYVLNLAVMILLFIIGGVISFADLEVSLRLAIKIAIIRKKQ